MSDCSESLGISIKNLRSLLHCRCNQWKQRDIESAGNLCDGKPGNHLGTVPSVPASRCPLSSATQWILSGLVENIVFAFASCESKLTILLELVTNGWEICVCDVDLTRELWAGLPITSHSRDKYSGSLQTFSDLIVTHSLHYKTSNRILINFWFKILLKKLYFPLTRCEKLSVCSVSAAATPPPQQPGAGSFLIRGYHGVLDRTDNKSEFEEHKVMKNTAIVKYRLHFSFWDSPKKQSVKTTLITDLYLNYNKSLVKINQLSVLQSIGVLFKYKYQREDSERCISVCWPESSWPHPAWLMMIPCWRWVLLNLTTQLT